MANGEPGRRRERLPVGAQVVLIALVVLLVHLAFLGATWIPDEAGFYLVGRDLSLHGPNLYGHYWVDRPPGLIALNALAALTGHLVSVRVLAALCAAVTVLLVAAASAKAKGSALVAAVAAAALLCAPTLETLNATGEMFAAPWMALSILCVVAAVSEDSRRPVLLAFSAGLAATVAVSIKQNMLDGAVFAAVLVLLMLIRRELPWRSGVRLAAAGVAGGLVVVVATAVFAAATPAGIPALWEAAVGFRADASQVLFRHHPWNFLSLRTENGNIVRLQILFVLALMSGIVPMYLLLVTRAIGARLRGTALAWAATTCLTLDLFSLAAGGSYWPHYLIQPVPVLALCLGWLGGVSRVWVIGLALLSTTVTLVVAMQTTVLHPPRDRNAALGDWVRRASTSGDTAVVLYGHADILYRSGLSSPYEYLWSLPTRTRDRHLDELTGVLTGPKAPRFVVTEDRPASMGLRAGPMQVALAQEYDAMPRVCGRAVLWVRRGESQGLPPVPRCAGAPRQPQWYVARWVKKERRAITDRPTGRGVR